MRITRSHITTALNALIAAGDQGVHSYKLLLLTQYNFPIRLIKKLEQEGYIFKIKPMVQLGNRLGSVFILLEQHPRKYMTWNYRKTPDNRYIAYMAEVESLPRQEMLCL